MSYEKYLIQKGTQQEIEIPIDKCEFCDKNGLNDSCADHGANCEDKIALTIRPLSWSRRNQITTRAMYWDTDGNTRFDGDYYLRESLKHIIVKAPWGPTTETFLMQVGPEFGEALDTLVPRAFNQNQSVPSVEEIKKE